ncbi:MAG: ABC transporter permease [Ardenticatenaceae bacterium]|nr:ABC transporter permease [Ardenticatenaceae bacterium]HBY92342.1 taurine ABC transporter permease [Chloroflexota bacterium]
MPAPSARVAGRDAEPVAEEVSLEIAAPSRIKTGPTRTERLMHSPLGTILPVIAVILLWEIGSALGVIDPIFFPAPSRIARALVHLVQEGVIAQHLGITIRRVALGFTIGTVPAVAIGVLMARIGWLSALLDPLISLTYPIPHIAILPLLLVIFGLGSPPIIALSAIVCFYPAIVNTLAGVRQVDERLVMMARNLGASNRQILWKIALPGALPTIFAGLRLGLGLALLGAVAGEFVAASDGIGAQTWIYWQIYQIDNMYATLIVIVTIGFLTTNAMLAIERRFFGWSKATQKQL